MPYEPDITAFCHQDGDLPPTVRALFAEQPAERRSAPANDAANPARRRIDPALVIGRRVAFLMQRREVEGRIEAIDRVRGEAHVRIETTPFTSQLHVEPLAHLVAIDANGDPLEGGDQ